MKTLITLLLIANFANAYESSEEDYYNYDTIVDQLRYKSPEEQAAIDSNLYDDIYFHVGAGFSQSILNIRGNSQSDTVSMNGIEMKGAINLFNPFWLAEGTIRNFNNTNGSKASYKLREFELKVSRFTPMSRNWLYRVTTGLAARFLKTNIDTNDGSIKNYSTPSLILGGGLGYNLNPRMSLIGDVAFKASMINDTVDRNTLDFTLRLDTRF